MEYVTLNNGIRMPKLGYGVYQTPAEDTKRCVLDAIDVGYRSIDTAQAYYNEAGVGDALAESGLPREEFFLTTKVWITSAGYEKARASIEESMRKLRTDYLDLLLIHQPFGDYYGTYRAMEERTRPAGSARSAFPTSARTGISTSSISQRSSLPSTRSRRMCSSSRKRRRNTSKSMAARSNPGARLPRAARICSRTLC